MYYKNVYCHLCGNLVYQTCGCCYNPTCELCNCPESFEDRKEHLQEKEEEEKDDDNC